MYKVILKWIKYNFEEMLCLLITYFGHLILGTKNTIFSVCLFLWKMRILPDIFEVMCILFRCASFIRGKKSLSSTNGGMTKDREAFRIWSSP